VRQAIEEGFNLDVLKNHTPYKQAFKLAHNGKELDDREVERSEALKGIMRWSDCTPTTSVRKCRSWSNISARMSLRCRMVEARRWWWSAVGSRMEAVLWRLAIDKYIKEQGYKIGTLVAFSGDVNDASPAPIHSAKPARL
jgi:type I restriction enzyme, R subunit